MACPVTCRIKLPNSGEKPGRRERPQMSLRTEPASTEASWSRSPISTSRAAPAGIHQLGHEGQIDHEASSTIIRSRQGVPAWC